MISRVNQSLISAGRDRPGRVRFCVRHALTDSKPGRSTLKVLKYKYKYFPPPKYLSTSTFDLGEMYSSTFRVLSKCT